MFLALNSMLSKLILIYKKKKNIINHGPKNEKLETKISNIRFMKQLKKHHTTLKPTKSSLLMKPNSNRGDKHLPRLSLVSEPDSLPKKKQVNPNKSSSNVFAENWRIRNET